MPGLFFLHETEKFVLLPSFLPARALRSGAYQAKPKDGTVRPVEFTVT